MRFLATHRKNVLSSRPINKREITPGDIIEFVYRSEEGNSIEIVICLDGLTGKLTNDNKLNAVKLENMSIPILKNFIKRIRKPVLLLEERNKKQMLKLNIQADTEAQRQVFYKRVVSRFVKHNIYRTYVDEKMTSIKLLEYDFKNKQLGIKDENLLQDTDA